MGERMMTSKHVQELAAVTRPCTGNSNEGKCTSDANATVQPKNVASNISLRVVAAAADIGKVEMSTWNAIKAWFGKMRGGIAKHPPSPPPTDVRPHFLARYICRLLRPIYKEPGTAHCEDHLRVPHIFAAHTSINLHGSRLYTSFEVPASTLHVCIVHLTVAGS